MKKEITESTAAGRTAAADVTAAMEDAKASARTNGHQAAMNGASVARVLTPFDPDAT